MSSQWKNSDGTSVIKCATRQAIHKLTDIEFEFLWRMPETP